MLTIIQNDQRVPAGLFGPRADRPARVVRLCDGEPLPDFSQVSGLMVLGGYMSVHDTLRYPYLTPLKEFMAAAVEREIPLLGICLGGQLLAEVLGAPVTCNHRGERGLLPLQLTPAAQSDPLFAGVSPTFHSLQWHSDSFDIPGGAVHLALSRHCPGQAFRYRRAWGLQFHPEVDETIVAAWSRFTGAGEEVVTGFRAGLDRHLATSGRLLANFLRLLGKAD
ncbi:GMP synthase [Desulfuromonas versatilis]|uniref:GMP synthase n=1 Tax=Desulfuromonas versatilis TaxID=2802975 RepID=A0ABM8HX39_9BACT|nr:type 1 glutamine amidotransferase [Desulfuromonas versatilis]BCR06532.1 GMP synthase [Desulfuromonas versatilis]